MVAGPVFISHSKNDASDVKALSEALRQAFNGAIRTFNTSTGTAIAAGENWRSQILSALRGSSVVILWATESSLQSMEVAFEVGAAYAYEKTVLSCCVHIAPNKLPWSLAERQALVMDRRENWHRLAETIAQSLDYGATLNLDALDALSNRYKAPQDALQVEPLGYTVEIKNVSLAALNEITARPAPGADFPKWAEGFRHVALQPGESTIVFRGPHAQAERLVLGWTDIAGQQQERELTVEPTEGTVP